jgi:hypothetical protein
MTNEAKCKLCGESMPPGEEMFKYHGYSGPCPAPPLAEEPRKPMPTPNESDLNSPIFEAIWNVIKTWDVNVPAYYSGYCAANGSHVKLILQGLQSWQDQMMAE